MARSPKLKVFTTAIGFHDAIVAAPSQAAALRAWGTTTDLFGAGRACIVEDEAVKAEALARPGEVIKRLRGDVAAMLGPEPDERPEPKRTRKAAKPSPAAARPAPDRSALDAAEAAVAEAERELAGELDSIGAERAELDRREAEVRSAAEAKLSALAQLREKAASAFGRASAKAAGAHRS